MSHVRAHVWTSVWLAAAVATAAGGSALAGPATPPRISIDRVEVREDSLTATWRARASGRYTVWLGGTYCGGGTRVAAGRYTASTRRTVAIQLRAPLRPGAWVRVCLRAGASALSDAVRAPEQRRSAKRISLDDVEWQSGTLAVTWRAAASGPYSVWLGGTYCGGGVRLATGRYAAAAPITLTRTVREAPLPGAWVRVCLRVGSGTLSDAVRLTAATFDEPLGTPGALDRVALVSAGALGLAAVLFGGVLPVAVNRRRSRTRSQDEGVGLASS